MKLHLLVGSHWAVKHCKILHLSIPQGLSTLVQKRLTFQLIMVGLYKPKKVQGYLLSY